MNLARQGVAELLEGVGDPEMERGFAMVMTLCAHRAVSDAELPGLPPGPARHLAGAGVRDMWRTERFPEVTLSLKRCERNVWWDVRPGLRIPGDCGECPPCVARLELAASR